VSLSDALRQAVEAALREAGERSRLVRLVPVAGGDTNHAARAETEERAYFLKWHHNPPPGFFEAEAHGLHLLTDKGTVRVPGVIGLGQVEGGLAFLLLEWIEQGDNGQRAAAARKLGRQLAQQHRVRHSLYGLESDNYIGMLPQQNERSDIWIEFYRERRLRVQRDLAEEKGYLPPQRAQRLDKLMSRLDIFIDEDEVTPALLHGDLWGGNWMAATGDEYVLIDPAVYIGCREIELALTELFGGFPLDFYAAYNEVYPIPPGYSERRELYQLYHLLTHLNLFGEGYGGAVDRILRHYVD
jgi:fructosamine-3-kinase